MAELRDWKEMRDMSARLLEERTGEGVAVWNARIREAGLEDEKSLRAWLGERGITGYAQTHLVHECFGYPEFMTATADELVDAQYADKLHLRPVYDRIVEATAVLGEVTIQTRKTYVSLVTPRRTFARIQAGKDRVHLALRLDGASPGGRLEKSRVHESMPVQISFGEVGEVDDEALKWMQRTYNENT